MTYYVVTVHHKSSDWIELQTNALRAMFPSDTQIVASLEGVHPRFASRFDRVVPSLGTHAGKLNLLADEVVVRASPSDVLVFLDGDAFPIAPVQTTIDAALGSASLAAVVRSENGDAQPHPCFAVTTCEFWLRVGGDWSSGFPWTNDITHEEITDVGGNLWFAIQQLGARWQPILRTASLADHPVFYGIYGDLVYHHGAGFREKLVRKDVVDRETARDRGRSEAVRSAEIYAQLPHRWTFLGTSDAGG